MCIVSNKIKFCTCLSSSVDKLQNYWLLHRFNKGKDLHVLGTPMMPSEYFESNYQLNIDTLSERLNEADAFDIPIKFKENDQLEIMLNNLSEDFTKRLTYCFKYKKGKWIAESFDTFELMNNYDELMFGKLKLIKKV